MNGLNDTIQLDPTAWDLLVDSSGNIALQTGSASTAQDVASMVKTFQGECWFDTTQGIPYMTQVLGQNYSASLLASLFNAAALTVPGVVQAQTTFTAPASDRKLSGTVEVIDTYGQSINAHF
jgi:hypothetical protein